MSYCDRYVHGMELCSVQCEECSDPRQLESNNAAGQAQVNAADGSDAPSQGRCKPAPAAPSEKDWQARALAAEKLSSEADQRVTVAPNVDGQDFYELCQAYRHSKEIAPHPSLPNTVQAFNNLREYIKTGKLPWPSYERSTDTEERE